eukprot:4279312-Prymnesium_polylepis.1
MCEPDECRRVRGSHGLHIDVGRHVGHDASPWCISARARGARRRRGAEMNTSNKLVLWHSTSYANRDVADQAPVKVAAAEAHRRLGRGMAAEAE